VLRGGRRSCGRRGFHTGGRAGVAERELRRVGGAAGVSRRREACGRVVCGGDVCSGHGYREGLRRRGFWRSGGRGAQGVAIMAAHMAAARWRVTTLSRLEAEHANVDAYSEYLISCKEV
jgi:hypothetical protein